VKCRSWVFFVFFLFTVPLLFPEESEPLWVLVEKGKAELQKKEYGNALHYFKEVLLIREEYPEIYILIGDIYKTSDNPIAEEYYRQAYDLKYYFEVFLERYVALYKLIDLYKAEKDYRQYEAYLSITLSEDETYLSDYFNQYKNDYYSIFTTKGLNRLLVLYRITGYQHVIKAHAELGWYKYKTGMYKDSVIHLLFALVGIVSEAFEEVRHIKPLYEYSTMTDFLSTALVYDHIRAYLVDESDIYRLLYYLGCAEYALEKDYILSREIWQIITGSPVPNEYRSMARMQIQNPVPEPLIDVQKDLEYEWD
jgi:tetratricopeptide (TPR) repeat protein